MHPDYRMVSEEEIIMSMQARSNPSCKTYFPLFSSIFLYFPPKYEMPSSSRICVKILSNISPGRLPSSPAPDQIHSWTQTTTEEVVLIDSLRQIFIWNADPVRVQDWIAATLSDL
jgi:hypothetical protein